MPGRRPPGNLPGPDEIHVFLEATGVIIGGVGTFLRAKALKLAADAQEAGADVEVDLLRGKVKISNQPRPDAERAERELLMQGGELEDRRPGKKSKKKPKTR